MRSESVGGIVPPPFSETDDAVVEMVKTGMPFVRIDRSLSKARTDLAVTVRLQPELIIRRST